ncbi:transcriptional regulator [Alkalilimnicola ehrlichii]|uniref:Transcriptional regulator n=1 Tax=Alkalilimnicola ehrlichii TaxID=351052 RepID=A0A3E0X3T5_9GAMM|nr:RNA repair transcriptional activator RtcR [Alkalilimnicola ehrlichii]RFA31391.1 transcriptional regulator [Alkalilimnicola ehrlichii]RFA39335.1 transcriptional regulator [Alkalilimnicola ehrlichii]
MKTVVIGLLGSVMDNKGKGVKRWDAWRPTVGIFMQEDLIVDRLELLHDRRDERLANNIGADIETVSPGSEVKLTEINFTDAWDFEHVYSTLLDFAENYPFKPQEERYLLHITTGSHVAQICWFLLCEANYIPAQILQTSPTRGERCAAGNHQIIDLDLSKYDLINSRFRNQHLEGTEFLKSGIATRNRAFNELIQQVEKVAIRSTAPILITGPTGAGKSQLAKRIYELKRKRSLIEGEFVAVNCATIRGDGAMSALFGHTRGAFTGAQHARQGLLSKANRGLLFLDEIGELGLDEQAMLLHAIEEKQFYPVGSDTPQASDFQLIAGTNRDLHTQVQRGEFREDLLTRINLWSYRLPGLKDRREDIEPNLDYELQQAEIQHGHKVSLNKAARQRFLDFALSPEATWRGNFRDLNAAIQRMSTLADGGRITEQNVNDEIGRLKRHWQPRSQTHGPEANIDLADYIPEAELQEIDLLDQWQLLKIIDVCSQCRSLSDAGRLLFNRSRTRKRSTNDSHRLRQMLAKFNLSFEELTDRKSV